jgi:hypothetical protein
MVALPAPAGARVIRIQGWLDVAVQLHPSAVVSWIVCVPPATSKCSAAGEISYEQERPDWTIERLPLGNAMRAEREPAPGFDATTNGRLMLPVPLVAPGRLTHDASAAAVHGQSADVVMFMDPLPPSASNVSLFAVAA